MPIRKKIQDIELYTHVVRYHVAVDLWGTTRWRLGSGEP
jgi:hypothetical protein